MKKLLPFAGFLFFLQVSLAQNKKEKLHAVMKAYHQFNMFDGAVLVAENGKVIYKNAFGLANREWNVPNTTDTKFMIGSVSKPITAILVLIQVQKGLITLDKTIADYLPAFKGKPGAAVTIRQLLSHTSGIANYDITPDFFPRISRQHYTREDYVKVFMDSALLFEPGKSYSYSSWGYFTLGYIMEKVTGKTYSQLMKEDLFDKIGMNSSGSYFHTQVVSKRATGYDYDFDGYKSSDFRDQSNTMGTGDLYSTVEDLFKLHNAISQHSVLNKTLSDEMLKPGMAPVQYGFGWFNRQFKFGPDSVFANFHLGMTEGFISFMVRIPATNSLIVILCNSSPTDFFGICGNLAKVLYNKPAVVKEPVHKAMEVLIGSKGIAKAMEEYQRMKKDTARYYIDWISMNFLGDKLYDLKRYEEARTIYANNVADFPTKDLAVFSMGKISQALGQKEEAIKWYKKTLELFPKYEEARNRLKTLE